MHYNHVNYQKDIKIYRDLKELYTFFFRPARKFLWINKVQGIFDLSTFLTRVYSLHLDSFFITAFEHVSMGSCHVAFRNLRI